MSYELGVKKAEEAISFFFVFSPLVPLSPPEPHASRERVHHFSQRREPPHESGFTISPSPYLY